MYKGKIVSVVMGTYREKETIREVIEKYFKTGFVDEVVVVNNNAEPGTDEEVKKTSARIVYESRQGYGFAYKKALKEGKGDYVIVTEPDTSFRESDIVKFLEAAENVDVILGSRTGRETEMSLLRKWANIIEGKTIKILFKTNNLSDVGCTYKLFKKTALEKLKPFWRTKGSPLFNTELILLTISQGLKFKEVAIAYRQRKGESSIVGKWHQLVKWGAVIQLYIFYFYLSFNFSKLKKCLKKQRNN